MDRKIVKRILWMLLMPVICFTFFSFKAFAVSDDIKGSITLTTVDKESKETIGGAKFRLYFLASAAVDGDNISYVFNDEFQDNGMELGDFSEEYLPTHLAVYAEEKEITYNEKITDEAGKVVFDNLTYGAYLVVPVGIKEGYLNPQAFIVSVPIKDETESKWIDDVNATPKVEIDSNESEEKTYISVKKKWENTKKIPDAITVSLVMDGVAMDSVVLNEENNWYYRWDNLEGKHSWNVVEKDVPKGYTVSYITSEMTVTIVNTADDNGEDNPPKPGDTPPDKLIQTSQLNWPIPVLAIAGLLLFSIGWSMLNFGKKDDDTL